MRDFTEEELVVVAGAGYAQPCHSAPSPSPLALDVKATLDLKVSLTDVISLIL